MKALKSKKGYPSQKRAKQRSDDFRAGIEAARAAIAPLIMRKYFLRGMAAGAFVLAVVTALALAGLLYGGVIVVSFPAL